ncbi:MAG: CbiX/SirB N-terminal domain-containing protein [Gammaproteobacteria bacterium]|nr:CbiX/SirB N-terminal domain-containing protein [Gammaproteobacteria bacterium]
MSTANALVLVAHGSRFEDSNREVESLTERLSHLLDAEYAQTVCAFLELAEPSIAESIDKMIELGATHITVLPYFLVAGRHVSQDIPEIVNAKRKQYPGLRIDLADYLGSHARIVELLCEAVLPGYDTR